MSDLKSIQIINAFTTSETGGNPAAISYLSQDSKECFNDIAWMSAIAKEVGLPETAFIVANDSDGSQNKFKIRWFASDGKEEVLCGHATLASAHYLYTETQLASLDKPIDFESTKSGHLFASYVPGKSAMYMLNFPAKPSVRQLRFEDMDNHEALLRSLCIASRDQLVALDESELDLIIEVDNSSIVFNANQVDFSQLGSWPRYRSFTLTAKASSDDTKRTENIEVDFVSRCFFHRTGEDPVTGSAHCALACYWDNKLSKSDMTAYQASSRGGLLKLRVCHDSDGAPERVELTGSCVSIYK